MHVNSPVAHPRRMIAKVVALALLLMTPIIVLADYWKTPFKVDGCVARGFRQYSSQLMDIVGSWEAACAAKSADIDGQHFDQPNRCVNSNGMWGEFDVRDVTCDPQWVSITPQACRQEGIRQYSGQLINIIGSWEDACAQMPATVADQYFDHPTRCVNNNGMWGEFDVVDESCPHWGSFKQDACTGVGKRQYSSVLADIPDGSDWNVACNAKGAVVAGQTFTAPTRCVARDTAMWGEFDVDDSSCIPPLITGNIQYSETEATLTPRPVAGAEIELWVCGDWVGIACGWNKLAEGKTDDLGNYSWPIAGPRDPRDQYQVRVYARNSAAIVWQQDTGSNFWSDVLPQAVTAAPGNPVVNISRVFGNVGNDLFVSRHLNAAQKLLEARNFVLRFRDDSESDPLGRVIVGPSIATETAFMNSGVIRLNPNDMFDEDTLVHEYAHFVQESIGAYYLWPSVHDGCFIGDRSSPDNTPEFAWFEGFPEFFSAAVRMYSSASYNTKVSPKTLSSFVATPCSAIGMMGHAGSSITPEAVERRVTDFLFLLLNDSGPSPVCGVAVNAPTYRNCALPIWDKNAKLIMSIFDKELDFSQPNPVNVNSFVDAWLARGGDQAHLNAAMNAVGMTPPPVVYPPHSSHAECIDGCNQQQADCMAAAHTGMERGECVREATICNAACPP